MKGDRRAEYVALARHLRDLAQDCDVPENERSRYLQRNDRERCVARHYAAYGLRWAAQILEEIDGDKLAAIREAHGLAPALIDGDGS